LSGRIFFESRIHKVAIEIPNVTEGLVGVQLCTPFLLQTDGTANTTFSQQHHPYRAMVL